MASNMKTKDRCCHLCKAKVEQLHVLQLIFASRCTTRMMALHCAESQATKRPMAFVASHGLLGEPNHSQDGASQAQIFDHFHKAMLKGPSPFATCQCLCGCPLNCHESTHVLPARGLGRPRLTQTASIRSKLCQDDRLMRANRTILRLRQSVSCKIPRGMKMPKPADSQNECSGSNASLQM